jgi:hypothetical protein
VLAKAGGFKIAGPCIGFAKTATKILGEMAPSRSAGVTERSL